MATTVPLRMAGRTGVALPAVGLGTWRTFDHQADLDLRRLADVVRLAGEIGGTLVDTAPVYGRSESNLASLLRGDRRFFIATKIWDSDVDSVEAVFAKQLRAYGRESIDLLQVHNLNGWRANLRWLARQKAVGRVRFIGVTYQLDNAFGLGGTRADLARIVADELVDFIQVNLNAAEAELAEDILPAAAEHGIGVLVMRPFGEGGLLASPPPRGWLRELGCTTWSEALLRWALSHPEVTSVLTATSRPEHVLANAIAARSGSLGAAEMAEVTRYISGLHCSTNR